MDKTFKRTIQSNAPKIFSSTLLQSRVVALERRSRLNRIRLRRYITRPALANDRVKINGQGQVELKLKAP
jgi:hypothetical protein